MDGKAIRRRQRGGGNTKAIIWIAILILLVYLAFKVIPPFVNDYELRDHMEQTARYAAVSNQTEADIRTAIWRKVEELEIPASREALRVVRQTRRVQISLPYTVEVPILGYTMKLNFSPQVDNRGY
ncbi:MAG: DUF4845 domain-containing protein [Candidatus Acidiferrales bacterium]